MKNGSKKLKILFGLFILFSLFFTNSVSADTFTKLHDIDYGAQGNSPVGSLILSGDKFYGMMLSGGDEEYQCGVIFEIDPITKIYTKKINIGVNDCGPMGTLAVKDGVLFGMDSMGGPNFFMGSIFSYDPISNNFTSLYEFDDSGDLSPFYGHFELYNDKFYGTSASGGVNSKGSIFEFDPLLNTVTKRLDFNGANNGQSPTGSLVLRDNKFYGITTHGGTSGLGTIFEWDPNTNTIIKKFNFGGAVEYYPNSFVLKDNKFYGATFNGGDNGKGVIFEWDPATNTYTRKYNFIGVAGRTLTLNNGKFYGTKNSGGANGKGVIFEWDPVTNTYTDKYDFSIESGWNLSDSFLSYNNKLYGMTNFGGTNSIGTIFEYNPSDNTPPTATSVTVNGTTNINETLEGTYLYEDVDGDPEGVSTFRWLRDDVAIDGATETTYTTTADDVGTTLKFEVTPVAETGETPGDPVLSLGEFIYDIEPDAYAFDDQTEVAKNTLIESNEITVLGIDTTSPIEIISCDTTCDYKINDGEYTTDAGTIELNDVIIVRQLSSTDNNTETNLELSIGGINDTFTIRTIADPNAPVITLNGSSRVEIYKGETYTDQGATALDDVDGDITSSIVTVSNVNTNVLGTYTVTYNVDDSASNHATEVVRTVVVNKKPVTIGYSIPSRLNLNTNNTPPTPKPKYTFTKNLKLNLINDEARELQKFLNTHGYTISLTGPGSAGNETTKFGPLTKKALIRFQLANGLKGDGILGPLTRAFLNR